MWLEGQATDQICQTIYTYTPSSSLDMVVETCQQPLVTMGLYFFDFIFVCAMAYLIHCFIIKKYL